MAVVAVISGLLFAAWPRELATPPSNAPTNQINDQNDRDDASITTGAAIQGQNEGLKAGGPAYRGSKESGQLLNQQALNAWYAGEIREAVALFEQAVQAAPDDPTPHSNYGRLLTLMVSFQKALPLLERARDLRPDDAQMWLDLATLYERAQVFEKSWEARARATDLVGSDAITRDPQGRFIVLGNSL